MAKHISRRRIPSRNIRQIAQPPEISAKEINAAPSNAQNDDYHSENNWNNDDVVNQKLEKKSTKMWSKAMKLTESTLTSRPNLRSWSDYTTQTRSRVINRADNAGTPGFIGGGPKAHITDGVATVLDFISLFFWRSHDEDFCWQNKRVCCINWSKC